MTTAVARRLGRPGLGVVAAAALTAALAAQEPQPQFSSSVQLVEVYATVTDASGGPVTGLRQSDFTVFEDDERQVRETRRARGRVDAA